MSANSRSLALQSAGLTILSLSLLSGCATQETVTEKTDPLWYKVNQLDSSLQSAAADSKARDDLITRQLETLLSEVRTLQTGQAEQTERVNKIELRLDELSTSTRENTADTASSQAQLATIAAQSAELTERMAKTDLRLDELATVVRETADTAATTREALATGTGSAAALSERVARTEKQVEMLTAQMQEALAASRQDYIRQHGKVAAIVLLTEDKTLYPINSPELGAGDRAKLDELGTRLKGSEEEYHLDIQGHTDNLGTDDNNYALGRARAEVVKRYLHERAGVPLSRMSTISYGATQPVTGSSTGNRRIVINLLVLEKDRK
jgi:outer membrane protein OmpA-like peptidoglycan-associated protein